MRGRVTAIMAKVVLPAAGIAAWLLFSWWACRTSGHFSPVLLWVIAGFPFGIRRMGMLIPFGGSLMYTLGIILLDIIAGGLIGGFCLVGGIIRIVVSFFRIISVKTEIAA